MTSSDFRRRSNPFGSLRTDSLPRQTLCRAHTRLALLRYLRQSTQATLECKQTTQVEMRMFLQHRYGDHDRVVQIRGLPGAHGSHWLAPEIEEYVPGSQSCTTPRKFEHLTQQTHAGTHYAVVDAVMQRGIGALVWQVFPDGACAHERRQISREWLLFCVAVETLTC